MSITPPAPDDPFAATRAAAEAGSGEAAPVLITEGRSRERWPVPLFALATVGAVVWALGAVEPPVASVVVSTSPGLPTATPAAAETPAPTEPVAEPELEAEAEPAEEEQAVSGPVGDGGSLWKPDNLRAALRSMRAVADDAPLISSLRVDTDYLVAEYMHGKRRIHVYANRDGRVDASSERIGSPTDEGVPADRVNSRVPDRVARRIAAIAKVQPGKVDYLVLRRLSGKTQWIGFLDSETDYDRQLNPFFANLDGSGVKANGAGARR